jgi:hypothetical protein
MDGKHMVKIISLLGFLTIYFSAWGQKASYYIDPSANLNQFQHFNMPGSSLMPAELTHPFLDKSKLNYNNRRDFALYNELSLKNLSFLPEKSDDSVLEVFLYEAASFENRTTPKGYKSKKLKGQFLILDMLNSSNHTLVWRGWIDLKKIKAITPAEKNQKAMIAILTNLKIEPAIIE